jgi:ATP-binding protein involved in chromosome partitioning
LRDFYKERSVSGLPVIWGNYPLGFGVSGELCLFASQRLITEEMAMAQEEQILALLKQVKYPGLDRDIVTLGYVKKIEPFETGFQIELSIATTETAAIDAIEQSALTVLADAPVPCQLKITTPPPPDAGDKSTKQVQIEDILPQVKYKIAIASGKGGVGKSTVAVNLALALAKQGKRVGLLDADIYGPSLPTMLGIQGQLPQMVDKKVIPIAVNGISAMSIGLLTDTTQPVIWRGPMASRALEQLLSDIDWSGIDYLLFDMPPGTGDIQISLSQKAALSGALVVTTPQDVALIDAIKGVRMFQKMDVPVFGIIENMSGFVCPHCHEKTDIYPTGKLTAEMNTLGAKRIAQIPIDPAIAGGSDEGKPVVISLPDSPVAKAFVDLASEVIGSFPSD